MIDLHDIAQFFIHTAHAASQAAPHAAEAVQQAAEIAQQAAPAVGEAATHAESTGVLGTLGIDWKLFIGQLINFAIILAVLWKWVFTPVAKKLTERTEKIEKSLHDADRITKEKQEFESWRAQELSRAKVEASEIVTSAQTEALKIKQQIAEETKREQQKLIEQARNQIETEKQKAVSEAKSQIADMVTAATEKIIKKKLDDKTDKELIKESLATIK